jgi:hypothetical protein
MTYQTPQALRAALEQRLLNQSEASGVPLDRLRRRVVFERVVARLHAAEPGRWVLKGGMALEVRLRDRARLTKDIDVGLREPVDDERILHARLVEAFAADVYADWFVLTVEPLSRLTEDAAGLVTWRTTVDARLAAKPFGRVKLDISPRAHELDMTDEIPLPNSLSFAGIDVPIIEIIDVQRHVAEKFHAMQRDFGDRDNSRVRDLVDIVILHENDLLDLARLAVATREVWLEREGTQPPTTLTPYPHSWPDRYTRLVTDLDVEARTFPAAVAIARRLWADVLGMDETPPDAAANQHQNK